VSQSASTVIEISQATFDGAPLPNGWQWIRLGELCIGSGQYGTSEKANGNQSTGTPVLGMSNIFEGRLRWDNLRFINLSPAELDKYRLNKGDVLFNRTNSAELVGKTAVFDGSRDAVFASYLIRLRLREAMANPHFIAAYINSAGGRRFIEANMARAIGQVNISASTLMTMPVPIAPLAEQHRIAVILKEQISAVERARAAAEAQLKAAKDLPAAYLREVFESSEAQQWQEKRIGEVCAVTKLAGFEYTKYIKYVPDGEYIALRAQNVRNEGLDLRNVVRISREVASALYRSKLDKDDVVMTFIGANIGEATWVDKSDTFYCAPNIAKITPNPECIDHRFLTLAIQSRPFQKQIQAINASTAQQSLSMRDIRNFTVPLPSLDEQRQLAAKLLEYRLSAKMLRDKLQEQFDAIHPLPATLLRQAFTGKL
jgi:type I restriction enzyme S subunit